MINFVVANVEYQTSNNAIMTAIQLKTYWKIKKLLKILMKLKMMLAKMIWG